MRVIILIGYWMRKAAIAVEKEELFERHVDASRAVVLGDPLRRLKFKKDWPKRPKPQTEH